MPAGAHYLKVAHAQEDKCERITRKQIPKLGKLAPQCIEALGEAMLMLDATASCAWGCRNGDHTTEHLLGRACSSSRAALRLLYFGFYDEALTLIRSIGEIANLLLLFHLDTTAYAEWNALPENQRRKKFSPVHIRIALEGIAKARSADVTFLSIRHDHYSELSARSAHVTPDTKPQDYNLPGRPILGGLFQEVGFIVGLNELCHGVGLTLVVAPSLLGYDVSRRKEVHQAAITLLSSIGSLNVMTDWKKLVRSTSNPTAPPFETVS